MANFLDVFTYLDAVRDSVNNVTKVFLSGTTTSGGVLIGTGQNVAVESAALGDKNLYTFTLKAAQASLEQTINGETMTGLLPSVYLMKLIYDNVSSAVASYANDGFGKLLSLNDYLDVTNSGCYFISGAKPVFYAKRGWSQLAQEGTKNPVLFVPSEDDNDTNSFFLPSISFVKAFESVPFLFNVNFQPVMKCTFASGQGSNLPPRCDLFLDWQCEYHVVGGA